MISGSPATINSDVILGAAIALLGSIITSLVVHWLELSRSKRARKWEIEDRQQAEMAEIIKARVSQIEETLNSLWDVVNKIIDGEVRLLALEKDIPFQEMLQIVAKGDKSVLDSLALVKDNDPFMFDVNTSKLKDYITAEQECIRSGSNVISKALRTLPYVSSLGRQDFADHVDEFLSIASNEISHYARLLTTVLDKGTISVEDESNRVHQVRKKLIDIHGIILHEMALIQTSYSLLGD